MPPPVIVYCLNINSVANCGRTSITVSEEEETPVVVESVAGGYICCFDPIDGCVHMRCSASAAPADSIMHDTENFHAFMQQLPVIALQIFKP